MKVINSPCEDKGIDKVEASAELLGKLENVYQEGVRNAEQEARFDIFWK